MLALAGVTVVLGARMLINRSTPAQAKASEQTVPANTADAMDLSRAKGEAAERAARIRKYLSTVDTSLKRDLFAVDFRRFAKIDPTAADGPRRADVEELDRLIGKLKLQSTVLGDCPTAIINGRMFTVGRTIKLTAGRSAGTKTLSVKVLQIGPRACVVGTGPIRRILRIDGKGPSPKP